MSPKTKTPAVVAEALGQPIEFEFGGVEYAIENTEKWPYEALVALEEGRLVTFLRMVLGEDQHEAFRATAPAVEDVNGLVEAMQAAAGISGN